MPPAITCEFSLAHNSYGLPKWKCQPKILVRECLMGVWKTISQTLRCVFIIFFYVYTSVDTEMCCPKGKCGCHYFILLTLRRKKIMDTGVLDFFNKILILDYYFCLKSGPVFLFQIFIIAPLPLPRDIKLYH